VREVRVSGIELLDPIRRQQLFQRQKALIFATPTHIYLLRLVMMSPGWLSIIDSIYVLHPPAHMICNQAHIITTGLTFIATNQGRGAPHPHARNSLTPPPNPPILAPRTFGQALLPYDQKTHVASRS
jgi:hypothetical protein